MRVTGKSTCPDCHAQNIRVGDLADTAERERMRLEHTPNCANFDAAMREYLDEIAEWHVVSDAAGLVLAVYGAALLSNAQESCRRKERQTGEYIILHKIVGNQPSVGGYISMRNAVTAWGGAL